MSYLVMLEEEAQRLAIVMVRLDGRIRYPRRYERKELEEAREMAATTRSALLRRLWRMQQRGTGETPAQANL